MTTAERIAVALERIADHLDRAKPLPPLTAEEVAERLAVSAAKVYQLASQPKPTSDQDRPRNPVQA